MIDNHVLEAFGELRLSEVTVPRLDKFFPTLQARSSAAHARDRASSGRWDSAIRRAARRDHHEPDSGYRADRGRDEEENSRVDARGTAGVVVPARTRSEGSREGSARPDAVHARNGSPDR
nr:hypothetical protein [Amycolatopsis sp. GM8]